MKWTIIIFIGLKIYLGDVMKLKFLLTCLILTKFYSCFSMQENADAIFGACNDLDGFSNEDKIPEDLELASVLIDGFDEVAFAQEFSRSCSTRESGTLSSRFLSRESQEESSPKVPSQCAFRLIATPTTKTPISAPSTTPTNKKRSSQALEETCDLLDRSYDEFSTKKQKTDN